MRFTSESGPAAKGTRERLKINQKAFWARVNVTQSGGSRYETGREMPEPVAECLTIAYGGEQEAVRAVKRLNPELGKRLNGNS